MVSLTEILIRFEYSVEAMKARSYSKYGTTSTHTCTDKVLPQFILTFAVGTQQGSVNFLGVLENIDLRILKIVDLRLDIKVAVEYSEEDGQRNDRP